MLKKLFLIVFLSVPIFAQVHNTTLTWDSVGVNNSSFTIGLNNNFVNTEDSLYTIDVNGNLWRYDGGTSWTKIKDIEYYSNSGWLVIAQQYNTGDDNYIVIGDSLLRIMSQGSYDYFIGARHESTELNIYRFSNSALSTFYDYPNHDYMFAVPIFAEDFTTINDSIYFYSNASDSWGSDTTTYKIRWDNGASLTYESTNLPTSYPYPFSTGKERKVYKQFAINNTHYIVTGFWDTNARDNIGNPASDTLEIWQATDNYGRQFIKIATIDNDNDSYCAPKDIYVEGDSAFILVTDTDPTASAYGIWKFNGTTVSKVDLPTNLKPYTLYIDNNENWYLAMFQVGQDDSTKIYMKQGNNWSWTQYTADESHYVLPTYFTMFNNELYMGAVEGTYKRYIIPATGTGNATDYAKAIYKLTGFLDLQSPAAGDVYLYGDTVNITYTGRDSAIIYYSGDAGATYDLIDTASSSPYQWATPGAPNNHSQILITDIDSTLSDSSGIFTLDYKNINILSPNDSTANLTVGDTVNLEIECTGIDSVSIWYSVDDTLTWIPIQENIPVTATVDTISYNWILPNINGAIYLKASEVADTALYNFARPLTLIGDMKESYPAICWGAQDVSAVELRWLVDQSCGWVATVDWLKITAVINDKADGYSFLQETCPYPHTTCSVPLNTTGTYINTGGSITYEYLENFYQTADTVSYQGRRYYIKNDTLYCNDLRNNIDDIFLTDFSDYINVYYGGYYHGWYAAPTTLTVYNVQRSKIQNDTLASDTNFETLNDADFTPKIIMYAGARNGRVLSYSIDAIGWPNPLDPVYSIQKIFTSLTINRDYFRGIDPKIHKGN